MDQSRKPASHKPRARMAGLSLVELMIVITVGAILLTVGTATFRNISTSYRISGEVNGLLGDIQYARSEAIRQGQTVAICVSSSGTDCTGGSSWNQGWIVFVEPVVGTVSTGSNAALVLRKQVTFTGTDTLSNGALSNVVFDREGLALGLASGGALLTLHDANSTANLTRCLSVSNVGNVSVMLPVVLAAANTTCI